MRFYFSFIVFFFSISTNSLPSRLPQPPGIEKPCGFSPYLPSTGRERKRDEKRGMHERRNEPL